MQALQCGLLFVLGTYAATAFYSFLCRNGYLKIRILNSKARVPERGTPGSVGYDIFAMESMIIPANGRMKIPCGFALKPPLGTFAKIETRSSYSAQGIQCIGGVLDPDYTDEIHVVLQNHSSERFRIEPGDKIAQFVLYHADVCAIDIVSSLPKTQRKGGFGSTDKK